MAVDRIVAATGGGQGLRGEEKLRQGASGGQFLIARSMSGHQFCGGRAQME
jgi:hypothetical protein